MKITHAKALAGYRLELHFDNGEHGVVDLSSLGGRGVFAAWDDAELFNKVQTTSEGAVEWPGDLDMCQDSLYLRMTGTTPEGLFPALNQQTTHA